MKAFKEFFEECQQRKLFLPDGEFKTWQEFLDINGITEETIDMHPYCKIGDPILFFDAYNFGTHGFYEREGAGYLGEIDEMLNSVSAHKLGEIIYKELGNDLIDIRTESEKYYGGSDALDVTVSLDSGIADVKTKYISDGQTYFSTKLTNDKLNLAIHNFQYFISLVTLTKKKDNYLILIEPKFTKEITNKPKYAYHVIYTKDNDKLDRIRKVGLRPQVGVFPNGDALVSNERKNVIGRIRKGNRYFPERIYMFLDSDHIKKDLHDFIVDQRKWKSKDYTTLKIKLNKYITCWKNPVTDSDTNVFTYDNIPKSAIVGEFTNWRDL